MNLVCLVLDRLHSGYLGCYGNAWIRTPALDRIASRSLLLDQATLRTPDVGETYAEWWQRRGLIDSLKALGHQLTILSDDPAVAARAASAGFDDVVELAAPHADELADELEETAMAQFFAGAADLIEQQRAPFTLWLHTQSLGTAWDAPYEFREQYADPEEPPPLRTTEVPGLLLAEDYDPDLLTGFSHAYAGQMTALDTCLAGLLNALEESKHGGETAVALLSPRGFPLGEHGRVGTADDGLRNSLVQLVGLIQVPLIDIAGTRSPALLQPADVGLLLAEAAGASLAGHEPRLASLADGSFAGRDRLFLENSIGERAVRTAEWYCWRPAGPSQLYSKPDDRWEVNDVADRCAEVSQALESLFDAPDRDTRPLEGVAAQPE